MTASQLIEILKSHPADTLVVASWDSGWSNFEKFELAVNDRSPDGLSKSVLVFDVSEWGSYDF